jgi:hypothetical protein
MFRKGNGAPKTYQDSRTLDEDWKNRGLYFDAEMVPYTDGTYKVLKRVNRIIDEKPARCSSSKAVSHSRRGSLPGALREMPQALPTRLLSLLTRFGWRKSGRRILEQKQAERLT